VRSILVSLIMLSTTVAYADERITPFLKPGLDPANAPHQVFEEGAFLLGGSTDVWPGAPDFMLRMDKRLATWPLSDDGTPKFYARSGIFSDIGDAPDLVLRRAGPDNASKDGTPVPLEPGTNIGTLYWQSWGSRCENDRNGFNAGCGNNGRNAAIFARTLGQQTGSSRAGSLHLATTPEGNPGEPLVRIEITAGGDVVIGPDHDPVTLRVSRPEALRETALVTSFRVKGGIQIERVVVGEPDRCGSGYRCLRVPN